MGTLFRWLWGWRGEVGLTAGPWVCAYSGTRSINDRVDRRVDACEGDDMFVSSVCLGPTYFLAHSANGE